MKKIFTLAILLNLVTAGCLAQIYIEPIAGYQLDLNNQNKYKQFNTALQLTFRKNRHYELMLIVQKTWPVKYASSDSAFTPNPSMPLYTNAKKTIQASSFSVAVGHRLTLVGGKTRNIFSALLSSGLTVQNFEVKYDYDKINYTILNPDRTLKTTGLFFSGGFEYMRLLKNGRIFIQLIAATPPARKSVKYPASFGYMAPLSFNAGYSILIKK